MTTKTSLRQFWFCFSTGIFAGLATVAFAQTIPVEFARFDAYCEGPVFDGLGNLFVSHGTSFVSKIDQRGNVRLWLEAEKPNGHKILADGTHLLCVKGAILHLDERGKILGKAVERCNGIPLRAPNDITLAPRGGFYFTDPGGSRNAPVGTVHFVDAAGRTHLVAGGLWVPNGLVHSPNGRILYVAETVPNRVLWFSVRANGKLGPVNIFCELPSKSGVQAEPDGLAVDDAGNLYVAHLGMSSVQVIAPSGKMVKSLPAGNFDASNLAFGGHNMNDLYVTGSIGHRRNSPGRVFKLSLKSVKGMSSLPTRGTN